MRPPRHSAWFEYTLEEAGPSLRYDSDRPLQLMRTAGSLLNQHPALACFLGRGRKDRALRCLFPDNPPQRTAGFQLQMDHRTLYSHRPVLFADGDPHQDRQSCGSGVPARAEQVPVIWATDLDAQVRDVFLSRALFPFFHVICLFAEDVGGVEQVAHLLDGWARVGYGATQPSMRPRLIVVVEAEEEERSPDKFPWLQRLEAPEMYASIHLLAVGPSGSLSDEARYRTLKEEVFKALDWADRDRRDTGTHFSGGHLPGLLEQAVRHTARYPQEPLDLIGISRPSSVPAEWVAHLGRFLQMTDIPPETQDDIIVSSLLVDAFPPDTHAFLPRDLFRYRYQSVFLAALQRAAGPAAAERRSRSIESQLVQAHACMLERHVSAWEAHTRLLQELQPLLGRIFSNRTCLSCLLCSPQHPLACGHAICDRCITRYGSPRPRAESVYLMERCPLCQQPCAGCVTLLPPTAAVRALAMDGGGIRGVVTLQILRAMQDLLGPTCRLPGLFDVAFGTSAGGLIVLDIFARHKSVDQCLDAFQHLLFEFFNGQRRSRRLLSWPRRVIRGAMGRGLYDAEKVESLLRQHYSSNQRLFESESMSGTKIAVPTTTPDGTAILTNYKPASTRPDDAGYRDAPVECPQDEPLIWQWWAQSTLPQPLFGPFALSSLGDCWDGGLEHNNPIALCRQELQYMWPWRPPLGILLNIGTGETDHDRRRPPTGPATSHSPRRHFLWPVLHSFLKTMDGNASWLRVWHQTMQSDREPLSRLDVRLSGPEPRLDAAHRMGDLIRQTAMQGVGDHGRRYLLRLLAQRLFFELETAPERVADGQGYRCRGAIRCRIPGEVWASAVQHVDTSRKEYIFCNRPLRLSATKEVVCQKCGRYCVPVQLSVNCLDDIVTLSVQLDDGSRYPVGGFPNAMRWFVDQQGMSSIFGFAGPSLVTRDDCVACERRLVSRHDLRVRQLQSRRVVRIARPSSCSSQRTSVVHG